METSAVKMHKNMFSKAQFFRSSGECVMFVVLWMLNQITEKDCEITILGLIFLMSFQNMTVDVTLPNTAGKMSIEHITLFLIKYISEDAVDLKFPPDVNNNPSNHFKNIFLISFKNEVMCNKVEWQGKRIDL